jgi:hypothetical protein
MFHGYLYRTAFFEVAGDDAFGKRIFNEPLNRPS